MPHSSILTLIFKGDGTQIDTNRQKKKTTKKTQTNKNLERVNWINVSHPLLHQMNITFE